MSSNFRFLTYFSAKWIVLRSPHSPHNSTILFITVKHVFCAIGSGISVAPCIKVINICSKTDDSENMKRFPLRNENEYCYSILYCHIMHFECMNDRSSRLRHNMRKCTGKELPWSVMLILGDSLHEWKYLTSSAHISLFMACCDAKSWHWRIRKLLCKHAATSQLTLQHLLLKTRKGNLWADRSRFCPHSCWKWRQACIWCISLTKKIFNWVPQNLEEMFPGYK